jgi:hypothetical protein
MVDFTTNRGKDVSDFLNVDMFMTSELGKKVSG